MSEEQEDGGETSLLHPSCLGEIPKIVSTLETWKTINPDGERAGPSNCHQATDHVSAPISHCDASHCLFLFSFLSLSPALYFLHCSLVAREIPSTACPPKWDADRPKLEREVLAFQKLSGQSEEYVDSIRTCFHRLDKTYLLDFLVLFCVTQASGRTFNRRHAPASLVTALMEYLDNPGDKYLEIQKIVTRTERPIRSNRTTAILSESHGAEIDQVLDEADRRMPVMAPSRAPQHEQQDEGSDEEEEEWGLPESDRTIAAKKRRAAAELGSAGKEKKAKAGSGRRRAGGAGGGGGDGEEIGGSGVNSGGNSGNKSGPTAPLRSNPPRTPTLAHPINYNVNQNFGALTAALASTGANIRRPPQNKRAKQELWQEEEQEKIADLWVACDLCEKWRLLPPGTYESEDAIPSKWQCSENPDSSYNSCNIGEEQVASPTNTPEPTRKQIMPTFFDKDDYNEEIKQAMAIQKEMMKERDHDENYDDDDDEESDTSRTWSKTPPPVRIHMAVPEFYRRKVPVFRENGFSIGELHLTEKESIGDVRSMLQNLSQSADRFSLFKKSLKLGLTIPIPEAQDFKAAHDFFRDSADQILIVIDY